MVRTRRRPTTRIRSLSVSLLAAAVLVPLAPAVAASASETATARTGITSTYKDSALKRAKRAARVAAAVPTVSPPRTSTTAPTYADRVLVLTNAERTTRGLRALSFSSCADGYADSWAAELARVGTLSHQALLPILTACGARLAGENVAYGNVTPEQLVQMWMDSPGHRANLLNASFTHLGVGATTTATGRVYAAQIFLTK